MTIAASEEQLAVVDYICKGFNVIVDAIAGSGKSTTILTMAQAMPTKRFLQITYNSMLRKEFHAKLEEYNITNIEVHTFHSFAVKYYDPMAFTDQGIRTCLYDAAAAADANTSSNISVPKYDICVMDECQDMTPLYYHFIRHVLLTTQQHLQLLFLGDYMQCLYEFKGADSRFLTMADKLWADFPILGTSPQFVKCSLKTSYRITNQMASTINQVMLGEQRLHACRDGYPVIYVRNSRSNLEKIIIYHIKKILAEGDLPCDIFILGGSVKGTQSNIRKLENYLVENGIPCHVPMIETDKIDEKVSNGKVVFSTFHTVKGRQRKFVFVMGFDQSYFDIYGRNMVQEQCPNTLYVACTRATHKMFLLETDQFATDRPLSFLKMTHHEMKNKDFIDFKGNPQTVFWEKSATEQNSTTELNNKPLIRKITVNDLVRFISEDTLEKITPLINQLFIKKHVSCEMKPFTDEEIPCIVQFKGGYEDVSDLNGIAIPCMYYDYLSDYEYTPNTLYQLIKNVVQELKPNEHTFLKQIFATLNPKCSSISDYLYMSNVYTAFQERLYFKLKQIDHDSYTWLTEDVMNRCKSILDHVIGDTDYISEEVTIINYQMDTEHVLIDNILEPRLSDLGVKYRFNARVDLISDNDIWELKCTTHTSMEHMIQVILYAWIWGILYPEQKKHFQLFNVKTAEWFELVGTLDDYTDIIVHLIKGKYHSTDVLNDETFLERF
jgi:hypothetical protein